MSKRNAIFNVALYIVATELKHNCPSAGEWIKTGQDTPLDTNLTLKNEIWPLAITDTEV